MVDVLSSPDLREQRFTHTISDPDEYSKTLGVEWNSSLDHFRLTVADLPAQRQFTKRALASDIVRTFDVLGWFSPAVVKAKILLQQLWEERVQWDDPVPSALERVWLQWRTELTQFLEQQRQAADIPDFCTSQGIRWSFIPEHGPHFGGLWESAVKSVKFHLKRIVGNVKLTFEELTTVLAQVEACLNSRPLGSLPCDGDGIEVLTPGHFLIGRPLEGLPDPPSSSRPIPVLRRWNLCQALTRHFWKWWSTDYFASLRKFTKWHDSSRSTRVGDVVLLKEDTLVPAKWPLGRVAVVHPGKDRVVRVVTVRTATGSCKRPVTKIAVLLPVD